MDATDLLGTGWRFPPQFSKNGQKMLLGSDGTDVRESLEILLSTLVGERLYRPDFGCDLKRFMFEEVNSALATEIREMIVATVNAYEPRVEITKITITEAEESAYTLVINIDYRIVATNSAESMVYSLALF